MTSNYPGDQAPRKKLRWSALARRWAGWTVRARVAILTGALLVTLLAAFAASRVRVDSNLIALLPKHTGSVRALHELVDETGGAGDLMVMLESPDPDAALAAAKRLLPKVQALPWVEDARYGFEPDFFEKNGLLFVDPHDLQAAARRIEQHLDHAIARHNPLYVDLEEEDGPGESLGEIEKELESALPRKPYFTSRDGRIVLMVIRPSGIASDIPFVRRAHAELVDLVRRQDTSDLPTPVEVSVGGTFRNRLDEYDTLMRDVRSSALWVAVGITVFLALFFRSLLAVALVAAPLAMGLCWTFAIVYLSYGTLNTVTVFLVVILMGLGIDFGIHVLSRFLRERDGGRDLIDALSVTLSTAGRASLVAAGTTAASFFALVLTDFRGFSQFGVIAGTGLVATSLAYLVVLPALLSWVHDRGLIKRRVTFARPGRPLPRARTVLALSAGLTVVLGLYAPSARFEYDLRNIRARASDTREFNRKMRTVFERARDPAAILVDDAAEARALRAELQERRKRAGARSLIGDVRSVNQLLPDHLDEKLSTIARVRRRVERLRDHGWGSDSDELRRLEAMLDPEVIERIDQLPEALTRPFLGRSGNRQIVYVYQRDSLMDLENALSFSRELDDLRIDGKEVHAASEPLIFADILRVVSRDAPRALLLTGGVLLALLALDLGSLLGVVLVLLPVAVGAIWMAGMMGLLHVKLNVLNVCVLAAALGLGVDGGVHIYRSTRELGAGRMTEILGSTGGAVAASTITSMIGFGGMLSADHPGLRSIGVLALLALTASAAASVVVLPAVLAVIGLRRSEGGRRAPAAAATPEGKDIAGPPASSAEAS